MLTQKLKQQLSHIQAVPRQNSLVHNFFYKDIDIKELEYILENLNYAKLDKSLLYAQLLNLTLKFSVQNPALCERYIVTPSSSFIIEATNSFKLQTSIEKAIFDMKIVSYLDNRVSSMDPEIFSLWCRKICYLPKFEEYFRSYSKKGFKHIQQFNTILEKILLTKELDRATSSQTQCERKQFKL